MFHVLSVCTPCYMLLRVVGRFCAKFETGNLQTEATTPNIVGTCYSCWPTMLRPLARGLSYVLQQVVNSGLIYADVLNFVILSVQRVLETGNAPSDLHYSSCHAKAEFSNCLFIHSKYFCPQQNVPTLPNLRPRLHNISLLVFFSSFSLSRNVCSRRHSSITICYMLSGICYSCYVFRQ